MEHSEIVELTRRGRETHAQFTERLRSLLPNFPDEVLEQWLLENSGVLQDFPWLDPFQLEFRKENWPTNRVLAEVTHCHEVGVAIEVTKFLTWTEYRETYPPAKFMFENGTWPVPPVVYENIESKPILRDGGTAPFVMLEGMHRLGFLRALHQQWLQRVAPAHDIWIGRSRAS